MTSSIRRNPILRAVAVLALALGIFAAVPATSGAAEACVAPDGYGTVKPSLSANPSTVAPGGTTTITGSGFPPDCTLGISIGACGASGTSLGEVTTDADGGFTIPWAVPADQKPGEVLVCTSLGTIDVTTNVTVASTQVTTPGTGGTGGSQGSGALPATGSQVMPFVAGGVLLLVIGSLLVLSTRKRHASH